MTSKHASNGNRELLLQPVLRLLDVRRCLLGLLSMDKRE